MKKKEEEVKYIAISHNLKWQQLEFEPRSF